jgi:hypothetical protein
VPRHTWVKQTCVTFCCCFAQGVTGDGATGGSREQCDSNSKDCCNLPMLDCNLDAPKPGATGGIREPCNSDGSCNLPKLVCDPEGELPHRCRTYQCLSVRTGAWNGGGGEGASYIIKTFFYIGPSPPLPMVLYNKLKAPVVCNSGCMCVCVCVCVCSSDSLPSSLLPLLLYSALACGAISCISDCGSEGIGFDPHTGKSRVMLFSLSILADKIVLVVQSC